MKTLPHPHVHSTKVGDFIRPCFPARLSSTRLAPPLVPARVGTVLRVVAITPTAVRVGEQWLKSWIRCESESYPQIAP